MAGDNIKEITDGNFQSEIADNNGLSMVDFWAAWCGPCRIIAPFVEELAGEYAGRVTVGKLDVDNNQRTAAQGGGHGRGRRAQAGPGPQDPGAPGGLMQSKRGRVRCQTCARPAFAFCPTGCGLRCAGPPAYLQVILV
jgi:hypothetical protein